MLTGLGPNLSFLLSLIDYVVFFFLLGIYSKGNITILTTCHLNELYESRFNKKNYYYNENIVYVR